MKDCESCNGSGMLYYFMNDMRCNICKGSGKTPEETYLSSAKKVNSYLAKTQLDESSLAEDLMKITNSQIAETVRKNQAYGGAFEKTAVYLETLYPNGIPVKMYKEIAGQVLMVIKELRIATDNDPFGEKPHFDSLGYSLLRALQANHDKT